MSELTRLSTQIIDEGAPIFPVRSNNQLSEIGAEVAVVESFSNVIAVGTEEGMVLTDTSGSATGGAVVRSLRGWSSAPFHTVLYTHGHIDHVGGAGAFVENAESLGHPAPRFVGHENVAARFERYDLTAGYNTAINLRQFRDAAKMSIGGDRRFLPSTTPAPDLTFSDRMRLEVGGVPFELFHARGETDDHAWAWQPDRRMILAGDFFIWNFPNAGNPQKVQRFPREWAAALREMIAMEPELLVPAHGFPIEGAERIHRVLDDTASALESLVEQTLALMNEGARLDDIIHSVKLPAETMQKPYLRPLYDEPELIVNNIWRLYGGWYDGNPARLKPAPDAALAREVAQLAGGAAALTRRALELSEAGEERLACHLIEMAVQAEPTDREAHAARASLYAARRDKESSLMAKGIFGAAAQASSETE